MAHRQALSLDCGHHGTKSRTNPLVDADFMVDITENVFELPGQSIRVVGRKRRGRTVLLPTLGFVWRQAVSYSLCVLVY